MNLKNAIICSTLLLVSSWGLANRSGDMTAMFEAYTKVQISLANDDFDAAKKAAKHLRHQSGDLEASAEAVASASTIEEMRSKFGAFSESIMKLAEEAGYDKLSAFHCPMALEGKGANWLQEGAQVMNPYLGKSMLHCGAPIKREDTHDQEHDHEHHNH